METEEKRAAESREILERLERLESEVEEIRVRNCRVESDKAWELSRSRVLLLLILTYLLTSLVFWIIGVQYFLLNALIPTLGYYLSTQSLPFVKKWWLSRINSKGDPCDP